MGPNSKLILCSVVLAGVDSVQLDLGRISLVDWAYSLSLLRDQCHTLLGLLGYDEKRDKIYPYRKGGVGSNLGL